MNRFATYGVGVTAGLAGLFHLKSRFVEEPYLDHVIASSDSYVSVNESYKELLPTRAELIADLREEKEFDVLVIGGGATGAGVALDACTRGLKTALVEKYDYASGTSSKSTKLIHGGVRYLQKAIMGLDREQYHLVKEALHERANLLAIAPHLASPLPIMLPVYKWWQVPYFWVGIKLYDLVAGRKLVKSSYLIGKEKALECFPTLKSDNLCGAIIYYDGQQDDARMNLAIIQSAIRNQGKCVNYVEVVNLLFDQVNDGDVKKVRGARLRDNLTGEEWEVKAKSVINATGPFTDSIRKMNNEKETAICQPAAGVHLTLPDYFCPRNMGLLDPATSDGRVIFFLPWEGKTIAGTTDRKCDVTFDPEATQKEVQFILGEVKNYLNPDIQVRDEDILSTWCGIRPLVTDPSAKDTQSLSRNHVIDISESDLITIAGGKWTTYRAMAKDAVDAAVKTCKLFPKAENSTDGLLLEGANGWTPTFYIRLVQEYGLDPMIAEHLSHAYGTKSPLVAELATKSGKRWPTVGRKLVEDLPYIEAEVLFAVKHEYACKATDIISRRLRVAFLNVEAGNEIISKVVNIMGNELGWDADKKAVEEEEARASLCNMNYKKIVSKEAGVEYKNKEEPKISTQATAYAESAKLENSIIEEALTSSQPVIVETSSQSMEVITDDNYSK